MGIICIFSRLNPDHNRNTDIAYSDYSRLACNSQNLSKNPTSLFIMEVFSLSISTSFVLFRSSSSSSSLSEKALVYIAVHFLIKAAEK